LCNRPDRNRTTCFLRDDRRLDSIDLTGRPCEQNSSEQHEWHALQWRTPIITLNDHASLNNIGKLRASPSNAKRQPQERPRSKQSQPKSAQHEMDAT
jgi:hypothetical protein